MKKQVDTHVFSFFASMSYEADQFNETTGELDRFIVARNVLKFFLLGTEIDINDSEINKGIHLFVKALIFEHNPLLMAALRYEFQQVLDSMAKHLCTDILEDKPLKGLISHLLAIYPFFAQNDTQENLTIPQKINDKWQSITYNVEALDLSPKTGLISKLIRTQDHIYAYGLIPVDDHSEAPRQLLLMGTTFPTGQGAPFSICRLFDPGYSVGEGYDWTEVQAWLGKNPSKAMVTGMSQGGASAMFIAAQYAEHIMQADCFNPPALCAETLRRLETKWISISNRPIINIYMQKDDPVFPLEHGFLTGSHLHCISVKKTRSSLRIPIIPHMIIKVLEAHSQLYLGRGDAILEEHTEEENAQFSRMFFADIKTVVNWIISPFLHANLIAMLGLDHVKNWSLNTLPRIPVVIIGFIPYYTLKLSLILILLGPPAIILIPLLLLTALVSAIRICLRLSIEHAAKPDEMLSRGS